MKRNIELLSTTRRRLMRKSICLNKIQTTCSIISLFSAGVVFGSLFTSNNTVSKIAGIVNLSALTTYLTSEVLDRKNDDKLRELYDSTEV